MKKKKDPIAEKIRIIRKQNLALTQKEMAKKLRVSQEMVSKLECGGHNYSVCTLKKIAMLTHNPGDAMWFLLSDIFK